MNCHTDYIVRLSTKAGRNNGWCLQEFDRDGKQVGHDLFPWAWWLYFEVTKLRYTYSLQNDDPDRFRFDQEPKRSETDGADMVVTSSEEIRANLTPAHLRGQPPSYSMVGTNRQISTIQLSIYKSDKNACTISGGVSYTTEINFRDETFDDFIEVHLQLTPEKFDALAQRVNSGRRYEASLRLTSISGFYSNRHPMSPEISTDCIKVLTPDTNDHKVEAPEDTDINPPRLGRVREFQLMLEHKHIPTADSQDGVNSKHIAWAEEQAEAKVRIVSMEQDNLDDDAENGDRKLSYTLNKERAEILRRSRKYKLLNQMFREASSYAANNNLASDELDDLSHKIGSFFSTLEYAFQKDEWHDHENDPEALTDFYERSWQLWQHQPIRFDEIKKGEVPHVDRSSLTEAVAMYLDLPIRNQSIDRMLVDACIAAEVVAYANQMLYLPSFLRNLSASPFVKSHPLWQFIMGQILSFVIVIIMPLGLLVGVAKLFGLTNNWLFFIGLGFVILWALLFLIGLINLPSLWISETRQKRKVSKLLDSMHTVYMEIGGGAVVSARHIRERLDKAIDQGTVWPAEIFPLLDDIIERGGVM